MAQPIRSRIARALLRVPGDINAWLHDALNPVSSNFEGAPPRLTQLTPPPWFPRGVRVLSSPEMGSEGTAGGRFVVVGPRAWPHHIPGLEPELDPAVLMHELVHTQQARRWGPLFPYIYGLQESLARRRGEPYEGNPFERAALDAEALFRAIHARRKTGQGPRGAAGGR